MPTCKFSLLPCPPRQLLMYYLSLQVCHLPDISYKQDNKACGVLCLLSHSMMFLRFVYVVVCISTFLLSIAECYFTVCTYHILFIHSPAEDVWVVSTLCLRRIMLLTDILIQVLIQSLWGTYVPISLGLILVLRCLTF